MPVGEFGVVVRGEARDPRSGKMVPMPHSPGTRLFCVPANEWGMEIRNEPVTCRKVVAACLGSGWGGAVPHRGGDVARTAAGTTAARLGQRRLGLLRNVRPQADRRARLVRGLEEGVGGP